MNYAKQLKTQQWKDKRLYILRRDKFTCKKCGSKNKLHVHHKYYEDGLMAWEYEDKSLITLCSICHDYEHLKRPISSFYNPRNRNKDIKMTRKQREESAKRDKLLSDVDYFVLEKSKEPKKINKPLKFSGKNYIGVEWSRKEQSWKSYVIIDRQKHLCGIFVDEIKAVKARDLFILKKGLNQPLQFLKPA